MPMLRAIRTLNNLEAGTLSGSALQTLLANTGRLGDFVSLVTQRGHARRLAASSTAMAAVAASSTAMAAVAASSTAMAAIVASNTALAAVFASSTARVAIYDHATALATLTAIANVQTYLKTIATMHSTNNSSHTAVNTGRTLLVTQRVNSAAGTSYAGASGDSYSTASTVAVDRFVKVMNLTHRSSSVSYYSYVTYINMD